MNRISRNLSIIVRSEKLIARRQLAAIGRRAGILGAAAILGAMALIMLDIAGYLALAAVMAPAWAALLVALVNVVLAVLLVAISGNLTAERDIREVCEVRDMAIADLESEVVLATAEARDLAAALRKLARDPWGSMGSSLLGPLLSILLKALKK